MQNIIIKTAGTAIGKAVFWNRIIGSFPFQALCFLVWVAGLFSIGLLAGRFLLAIEISEHVTGWLFIIIGLFFAYLALRAFNYNKFRYPKLISLDEAKQTLSSGKVFNIYSIFSFELARCTYNVINSGRATSRDLIEAILTSKDIHFILLRLGLSEKDIKTLAKEFKGADNVEDIILRSLDYAITEKHHQIEVGDVFLALCEMDNFFSDIIANLGIDLKDVANLVYWQTLLVREHKKAKSLFDPDHFKFNGGIGRDWVFGYAPNIKAFAHDLTTELKERGLGLQIIGHQKEIDQIKEALVKMRGGNAVLVGEEGTGKTTTILGFADSVLQGKTNSILDFQHIIRLDPDLVMSGAADQNEVASRLSAIFNEAAYAGNIIIVIENITNFLSGGEAGTIDASEVLMSFLESSNIHIVATCNVIDYNKYIMTNPGMVEKFSRITMIEPNENELVRILEDTLPLIEHNTSSMICYEAIKETLKAADRYIMNVPEPERSISLLEGAATKAASVRGKTIVLPKDISDYVSEKYNVPTGEVEEKEKGKLISLEKIMHQNVIGQNEAISAIANAMRRARAGITESKKPIGSFLFLGPTGVGKTETAKALAEAYFGYKDKMIRFDMSEYKNQEDIYRLIGSNLGDEEFPGALTTAVRENPFSLLLFDEVEKANKEILDLFLQMLDEGFITDGSGRKVSMTNTIIIATSNAGANLVRESIKNGIQYDKVKENLLDNIQKEGIFRPEFLNRFTGVIAFSPLSPSEILSVAKLMISRLAASIQQNKNISLSFAPNVIERLAQLGYNPQMGARPMERIIQEKVENLLANKILTGELKKGDNYTVSLKDIG